MTGHRNYPVPKAVSATARLGISAPSLHYTAVAAARGGRVRGHHLPILASGPWEEGRTWAASVIQRETEAAIRKQDALLAAIDYDPGTYLYHGVMEADYPEVELLTSVVRSPNADGPLEVWDGLGWGDFDLGAEDTVYAVLDEATLAELLEALGGGSGGLVLRPTEPKGWIPGKAPVPVDQYSVLTASAPKSTGAMVAFYPDRAVAESLAAPGGEPVEDIHLTLAYLGDTTEESIDYQAVQRAVAKWSKLVRGMRGEVSGKGLFLGGEKPVTYASVDLPDLPAAREMLVNILESEGVPVRKDHGYTPHMTIAYDDLADWEVDVTPLEFGEVVAKYADDARVYPLGESVVAAGGAGPDIIYAIVDELDTAAVLDLIRVSPGPVAYRRVAGKWVADREVLLRLMGVDPPPVVEVDPERAADVIAQVDAFDAANPPEEPVTAAGEWDESKYKRKGGKFAPKPKARTGPGARRGGKKPPANQARGPRRPGAASPAGRGGGTTPSGAYRPEPGAPRTQGTPATTIGANGLPVSIEASGVERGFFRDKPPGFESWLRKFLAEHAPEPESAAPDGGKESTSNDDPNDEASKAARKTATEAADKKVKDEADSAKSGKPSWWGEVPAAYRGAMRQFLAEAKRNEAEGPPSERRARATAERVSAADAADRKFELKFAQEGLGESRRREIFDRQLKGLADRLARAGVDPAAAHRLIAMKAAEEKRKREDFARRRRLQVEQERVRRMAMRDAERTQQDRESLTAASRMPDKLKKFWSKGEGAAKIRWGTGGDFERCRRALAKYLPANAVSGACANLHHLATGSWPGRGREH